MKTISGILGVLFLLLLLATLGAAGISFGWLESSQRELAGYWPVLLGLAVANGVLSAVVYRRSRQRIQNGDAASFQ